jgi:hypothetical protein
VFSGINATEQEVHKRITTPRSRPALVLGHICEVLNSDKIAQVQKFLFIWSACLDLADGVHQKLHDGLIAVGVRARENIRPRVRLGVEIHELQK